MMKRAAFLYNTRSGRGRIAECAEAIRAVFAEYDYELELLPIDFNKNPFDGREQLELMVVAGGDGTVNFTVNAMRELLRGSEYGLYGLFPCCQRARRG